MGRWRPLAWRRLGMGWLGCRIGSRVTGRRRSRIAVLRLRSRILRSIRLRLRLSRLWLRRLRLRRPRVRWLCHYASVGFGWPRPPRLAARAGLSLRKKGPVGKTGLFTIPGSSYRHSTLARAPRTAWVIHVVGDLLRTIGADLTQPVDQLCVPANSRRSRP